MSILIKGMEMPIFEHQSWDICKGTDGKWYMVDNNAETSDGAWHEIVPVPSHGRLIDADALEKVMSEGIAPSVKDGGFKHPFDIIRAVANAPTIIEAEEGE